MFDRNWFRPEYKKQALTSFYIAFGLLILISLVKAIYHYIFHIFPQPLFLSIAQPYIIMLGFAFAIRSWTLMKVDEHEKKLARKLG